MVGCAPTTLARRGHLYVGSPARLNSMSSASLATIAEAAGVTQSGLLYHFPCKDALLLSLLAEGDQPGTNPDVSGLAVIEELRELFRESTGSPGLVRLLTSS